MPTTSNKASGFKPPLHLKEFPYKAVRSPVDDWNSVFLSGNKVEDDVLDAYHFMIEEEGFMMPAVTCRKSAHKPYRYRHF